MKSREILIYFSLIYNGDWDKIYNAIASHEEIDEEEAKILISKLKCKALTLLDDEYPDFLKTITKAPFVLYYYGDISLLDNKFKSIAVVGARKNTEYGEAWTKFLVKELCKELVIVSGMAKGIDSIAHWTAIENGGKTIAVLGTGIDNPFPLENIGLYERLKKEQLVISEYPGKTTGSIYSFPIRNRIVAGLTNICLVTDGLIKSGSSITASIVLNNGGYVCAIPHPLGRESLCNYLIHEGACLVTSAKEIYEEMGYQINNPIFEKKS